MLHVSTWVPPPVRFFCRSIFDPVTRKNTNDLYSYFVCRKKTREEIVEDLKASRESVEEHISGNINLFHVQRISVYISGDDYEATYKFDEMNVIYAGFHSIPDGMWGKIVPFADYSNPDMKTYTTFLSDMFDELIDYILSAPVETKISTIGFRYDECSFKPLLQ